MSGGCWSLASSSDTLTVPVEVSFEYHLSTRHSLKPSFKEPAHGAEGSVAWSSRRRVPARSPGGPARFASGDAAAAPADPEPGPRGVHLRRRPLGGRSRTAAGAAPDQHPRGRERSALLPRRAPHRLHLEPVGHPRGLRRRGRRAAPRNASPGTPPRAGPAAGPPTAAGCSTPRPGDRSRGPLPAVDGAAGGRSLRAASSAVGLRRVVRPGRATPRGGPDHSLGHGVARLPRRAEHAADDPRPGRPRGGAPPQRAHDRHRARCGWAGRSTSCPTATGR